MLLGISAYSPTKPMMPAPSNEEALREMIGGGSLQPLLQTKTRWYMSDLERAAIEADGGMLAKIGQLCRSMRRDGMISGLMSTRTSGLVSLPKRFRGDPELVAELTDETGTRTLFDEMFPPSELALLAADGIGIGVGIAEMVPVKGREHPVMVRLEPEFLQYRYNENRWYYLSTIGPMPITPGDGRWVLHTPGGMLNPWTYGEWHALGRSYITKEHAILHRSNYSAKLANPARVGHAPPGADESQRLSLISKLMQWGLNTVFALPVGWDVKLLESNGRGWEVFDKETDSANLEIMITLAGQVVTVTGGTGFANADIHQTIRSDLIKQTGLALAHTINTQGIPPWVVRRKGIDALANSPRLKYETDPPGDLKMAADAADSFGRGVKSANEALRPYGRKLDVEVMAARHHLPIADLTAKDLTLPTNEAAKVVTVDEARASQGLPGKGDERLLQELTDAAKTEVAETQADASKDVAAARPAPAPGGFKSMRRNRLTALGSVLRAGEFEESKHPRSDDGKFGSGGGGSSDSSPKDESSDEPRWSKADIHDAVESSATDRNAQHDAVKSAKVDMKAAEKLADKGDQAQDKLDFGDSPIQSASLAGIGLFPRDESETYEALTEPKQPERSDEAAIELAWREIHADAFEQDSDITKAENADRSVDELKDDLRAAEHGTPEDFKAVEAAAIEANALRNEQTRAINAAIDKIDGAAALHVEHDDRDEDDNDYDLFSLIDDHELGTVDRDTLIEAVQGNDSFSPVRNIDKAKKKVEKDAADY